MATPNEIEAALRAKLTTRESVRDFCGEIKWIGTSPSVPISDQEYIETNIRDLMDLTLSMNRMDYLSRKLGLPTSSEQAKSASKTATCIGVWTLIVAAMTLIVTLVIYHQPLYDILKSLWH